ncbi:MAG: hypothetical protein ACK6DZ_12375 [Acidobacteriota bacterium]
MSILPLGQLTRLTKAGSINIEYRYSTTANEGKIIGQRNWMTGEEVTYQFDEFERLIAAQTTNTAWGLSWSYL